MGLLSFVRPSPCLHTKYAMLLHYNNIVPVACCDPRLNIEQQFGIGTGMSSKPHLV